MKFSKLFLLMLVLTLLASLTGGAAGAPLAGPCVPGAAYDPACDADRDGDVDIFDIQLTAGHWNQTGTYVSDNNHNHLGQTWTGSNNPLKLTGAYGAPDSAPLVLSNTAGDGLSITSAANSGVYVNSAGSDGVHVYQAGSPSAQTPSSRSNGFEVEGAQGYGVWVGRADNSGVYVGATGNDGVYVGSADAEGVQVNSAGSDGVHVGRAGSPSTQTSSELNNGVEIEGAEDNGVYVGRADSCGVKVASAGELGVYVESAGLHGVDVASAGEFGVKVDWAGSIGVWVSSAGFTGVSANTEQANHEWGFYTPDKIYAGTALASNGPLLLVAQSGDSNRLETGDLVVVSGTGTTLGESESPLPLVRRANPGDGSVMGVVYRRFVAEEKVEESTRDGQVERQTRLDTRSAQGPVAPGDTLLVVVLGPAQVKVAPGADVRPGDLLAASSTGQATKAAPVTVGQVTFYAPGTVIGAAMSTLEQGQGAGLIWMLVNPR